MKRLTLPTLLLVAGLALVLVACPLTPSGPDDGADAADDDSADAGDDTGDDTTDDADQTAPTILTVFPPDGATDVPLNTVIEVDFSEPMDTASVESAFSLSDGSADCTGTCAWDGNCMTFDPTADLTMGTTYTATVSTAAKDLAGNAASTQSTFSFTTIANNPPVADAGADISFDYNDTTVAALDGSASADPDNDIASYQWSFLDGGTPAGSTLGNSDIVNADQAECSFDVSAEDADWSAEGTWTYTLELRVTDSFGAEDTDQVTVTVTGLGDVSVIVQ